MGIVSLLRSVIGSSDSIEEPKIVSNFNALQTLLNGNLDFNNLAANAGITAAQLAATVNQQVGINDGTIVRRGKCVVATQEARANAAYGLLPTPDRVQSVVLAADGILRIRYRAMWSESVNAAARAAVFISANQLKTHGTGLASPFAQEAGIGCGTPNITKRLMTVDYGLNASDAANATNYTGDVSTGQAWPTLGSGGGVLEVFAAAGTYDVSVQFKASSGSVTASNRVLLVEAIAFS